MRELFERRARGGPALLYVLLDSGLVSPGQMVAEARAMAHGGADVVQLRAKDLSDREFYDIAVGVHEVLQSHSLPLLVNDRVDVAMAAGVEGVHLGRDDLDPRTARVLLGPRACIGVTAHDERELGVIGPEADYVGFGAVFPTQTRPDSAVCGVPTLTRLAAGTSLPMIAIGGLGPANVEGLRGASIAGVAVGSAISPVREGGEALAALRRILDDWAE